MDLSKYLDLYLSESREHVSLLRESLVAAGEVGSEDVKELFRHAHSLKGMAASMGFDATSRLAHQLENLLNRWRQGESATSAQRRAAVRAVDTLDALLDEVQESSSDARLDGRVAEVLEELVGAGTTSESRQEPGPANPSVAPPSMLDSEGSPKNGDVPEALLTVAVDPASPLPAARLLVVAARVHELCGESVMEPDLETVKEKNLRTVAFHVAPGPHLKELARALRDLPEVSEVGLSVPPQRVEGPSGEARLIRSVRIRAEDLDELLAQTSELLYHLNQFESGMDGSERRRHRFWLEADRAKLNRLFDQVLSIRLVSFETLADRLGRAARDLSSRLGKAAKLEATGVEERADRALLEKLLDPLMHLIRNAIDHGLEDEAGRRAAGKPPEGSLRLEIRRESEALLVSVEDDGRGIDVEAIRDSAVQRGLYAPHEAAHMDHERLLDLLTAPAFSTRTEVTDVSGRGVGLDVVRAAVESMGGHLEMRSDLGAGSRFTLVIPSATTLNRVLVFGWDDEVRYGLPTSQISHIYPLSSTPLVWSGSRRFLQTGDELVPVLSWRPAAVGREGFGLRLMAPGRDKILLVSRVYQAERVVILPWGPPLEMIPEWMGGSLLSTGEIAYILDGRVLAKRDGEEQHVSPD
jgi:two-component system chemotaxis sensor kinase CheA